uniref:F5/8 type C domain-containing protein n=1 Tax=Desulfovibrio sp. U5L TaxID=596152 RepID=I2PYN6_9BACT
MQRFMLYHQTEGGILTVAPDLSAPDVYRDLLFVRRPEDVFGHVPADEDGLILTRGEVFYSSCGVVEPAAVRNRSIGNGNMENACWSPDPRNAVPEYVGVRFDQPARVTGFQFATNVSSAVNCPYGAGPCGHPTGFALEGSDDEANWTRLLAMTDFTGMREAHQSPFPTENASWWADGVFLSDRMDIADSHYFLAYRLVVSAFKPDIHGNYSIVELVLYGAF